VKMKNYRIKKKSYDLKRKQFVPQGVRVSLPKPKFPRRVVWDAHPAAEPPTKSKFPNK